jgi:paraquat-inducible protein B
MAAKEILDRLQRIDVEKLVASASAALDAVRELASSDEIRATLASLDRTLASVQQLSASLDRSVGPLASSVQQTAERAQALEAELRRTLASTRSLIEPGSPLAVELQAALAEVSGAARAMRSLAEALERDPSSLVRGRGERTR